MRVDFTEFKIVFHIFHLDGVNTLVINIQNDSPTAWIQGGKLPATCMLRSNLNGSSHAVLPADCLVLDPADVFINFSFVNFFLAHAMRVKVVVRVVSIKLEPLVAFETQNIPRTSLTYSIRNGCGLILFHVNSLIIIFTFQLFSL